MLYNELIVYQRLLELYQVNRAPVKATLLAGFVQYSDRWIRYTMVALERRGVVVRCGRRGGWLPALVA